MTGGSVGDRALYGLLGVFAAREAMVGAARRLAELGFRGVEAHTPYPVDELDAVVRPRGTVLLPALILAAATIGAAGGYLIQYWAAAVSYPLDVGGRPLNSWPAFFVSAFEATLLCAVAAAFFCLFAACRLPRLYHPIFAAEEIERASRDRFVLCVSASDPSFEAGTVRAVFECHGAERIAEVPAWR